MTKKLLIDASHAEETRVVVLDGNRLEDFDVETANRKQIKGNIYLAKVIRVEPSLQAAFVEYGGNRHGFLAFGEIHPDYYQIPVADRKRLLALQAEDAAEEEEHAEAEVTPVSAQPLEIKPIEILAAPPPEESLNSSPLEGEASVPAMNRPRRRRLPPPRPMQRRTSPPQRRAKPPMAMPSPPKRLLNRRMAKPLAASSLKSSRTASKRLPLKIWVATAMTPPRRASAASASAS